MAFIRYVFKIRYVSKIDTQKSFRTIKEAQEYDLEASMLVLSIKDFPSPDSPCARAIKFLADEIDGREPDSWISRPVNTGKAAG